MSAKIYFEEEYERFKESLSKDFETFVKEYQGKVGFFDPYNHYSVMWSLDISWWADVSPMLDSNGYLPLGKCKELIQLIQSREIKLSKDLIEGVIDEDEELSKEYFEEFFLDTKEKLITFLEKSIDLETPLKCDI